MAGRGIRDEDEPHGQRRQPEADQEFRAAALDRAVRLARAREQQRRARDHPHRLARPPNEPRREASFRERRRQRETRDAHARRDQRAEDRRCGEQEDVSLPIEGRMKVHALQRPRDEHRAQRISHRDPHRGRPRRADRDIHRERSERDARPCGESPPKQRRHRDAGRKPDERDIRADRWDHQPEPARDEIRQRDNHRGDDGLERGLLHCHERRTAQCCMRS